MPGLKCLRAPTAIVHCERLREITDYRLRGRQIDSELVFTLLQSHSPCTEREFLLAIFLDDRCVFIGYYFELRLIRDSRAFASLCKEVVTRVERYIYVHNVRSHLA